MSLNGLSHSLLAVWKSLSDQVQAFGVGERCYAKFYADCLKENSKKIKTDLVSFL